VPRFDRPAVVHGALVLFAGAIVAKAAQVQLFQADRWRAGAARQQVSDASLPAPRGAVTDAAGRVLVESRELVRLRVAPREVRERGRLRGLLLASGVPKPWAVRATDSTRRWVEIPGDWLPSEVAAVTATRGVHPVPVMQRVLSASEPVRRIVGRVGPDGAPVDGVELALDTLLRGTQGTRQLLRDARGARFESPAVASVAARPGHTVALTLNYALQDICERALADAVAAWAPRAATSWCSTRTTARSRPSRASAPTRAAPRPRRSPSRSSRGRRSSRSSRRRCWRAAAPARTRW
jgi:cell division protein FtsI (penicillin-binding protein 3)